MSFARITFSFTALALLLFAIVGCGGGHPELGIGTVQGYIYAAGGQIQAQTRADGQPIANAEVRVQATNLSTKTNAQGYFQLTGVPAGARTLLISAPGYQTMSAAVTVNANASVDIATSTLTAVTRKWTVLIYLNADNNLEDYGMEDVNEMEAAPDNAQVTIAVQMDRSPISYDPNNIYEKTNEDWVGGRRFVIHHDTDTSVMTSAKTENCLEVMGNVDMGDPATLSSFITWGKTNFPAEHYLLVVWNHGSGWRAFSATAAVTRGVSYDDTSGTHITTPELPGALATSPQLDIVSFDACDMQMLEIAYEMRNSCRYIVTSEEDVPLTGYKYDSWLDPLMANPDTSPHDLGVTMARETMNYYGPASNITHSVVDTAELGNLTASVDLLSQALIANGFNATLAGVRDQTECYAYTDYKDLYNYAQLVSASVSNQLVKNAANEVMAEVNKTVIANYHGTPHPNSHGISIFIPYPEVYSRLAGSYGQLDLAHDTHWDEWLAAETQ